MFTKDAYTGGEAAVMAGGLAANGGRFERSLTVDGRADGGVAWKNGGLLAAAQYNQTPRWTATVPNASVDQIPNPPRTTHQFPLGDTTITLYAKVEQRFGTHRLRLFGGAMLQEREAWGILPTASVEPLSAEIDSTYVVARWDTTFGDTSLSARFGWDNNQQRVDVGLLAALESLRPGDPLLVTVDAGKFSIAASIAHQWRQFDLSGGLDALVITFDDYGLYFASDRSLVPTVPALDPSERSLDMNVFLQSTWHAHECLSLTAGARLNRFDPGKIDPTLPDPEPVYTPNPRAALIATLHERAVLKLLYGRAFRVPSLFNLYVQAFGVIYGDPALVPETIDTAEFALDTTPIDGLNLRWAGYANISKNDIQLSADPLGRGGEVYTNQPGRIILGNELSLRYVLSGWLDAQAAAGYQEGRERKTDRYLSEIAKVIASASATLSLAGSSVRLTPLVRYIGPRNNLDGAAILDLTLYYDVRPWLTLGLVAKNLADKRYADVETARFDTPGGMFVNLPRTLGAWVSGRF